MNFFSLAESEIWYIWPETNAYTVLQVFIFILLFVLEEKQPIQVGHIF